MGASCDVWSPDAAGSCSCDRVIVVQDRAVTVGLTRLAHRSDLACLSDGYQLRSRMFSSSMRWFMIAALPVEVAHAIPFQAPQGC